METHTLEVPGATITYDVRGPLPPAGGRPPLLLVGQPMTAEGFDALAEHLSDRTVVTYDPRGLGRSTRLDGSTANDPVVQADDLHRLVEALGAGPVEVFASSGGAVTALAWLERHPADLGAVVAHEPPLVSFLPDATWASAAFDRVKEAYHDRGWGHGMAAFVGYVARQGEFDQAYLAQPLPDPAAFGMPVEDDGSRDDPLLSGSSDPVTAYRPDPAPLAGSPARVVVAVGVESAGTLTDRAARAAAEALGLPLVEFPSHHGGFSGEGFGHPGQPEAFAARLRAVLEDRA